MGSKTRLSSYCTKRDDNTVNLVTSRKTNGRLARPVILVTLLKILQSDWLVKCKDIMSMTLRGANFSGLFCKFPDFQATLYTIL